VAGSAGAISAVSRHPVVWLVYTLVRGAFVGWYPYPFVDVGSHGYGYVAVSSVLIGLL